MLLPGDHDEDKEEDEDLQELVGADAPFRRDSRLFVRRAQLHIREWLLTFLMNSHMAKNKQYTPRDIHITLAYITVAYITAATAATAEYKHFDDIASTR